jgi:outer membrane autotransporter protein
LEYGGNFVNKFYAGNRALGLVFGYENRDLENTANISGLTETISGATVHLGVRYYSLNLYLGLGVIHNSLTVNYTSGGRTTELKYSGLGARIEAGIDLYLGKTVLLTPRAHFDTSNLNQKDSSASNRLTEFGFGMGLGVRF